jgi:hypothetical protein
VGRAAVDIIVGPPRCASAKPLQSATFTDLPPAAVRKMQIAETVGRGGNPERQAADFGLRLVLAALVLAAAAQITLVVRPVGKKAMAIQRREHVVVRAPAEPNTQQSGEHDVP